MKREIIIKSEEEKSAYCEKVTLEEGELIRFKLQPVHCKFTDSEWFPIICFGRPGDTIELNWFKAQISHIIKNGCIVFEVDAYYEEDKIFRETKMEALIND